MSRMSAVAAAALFSAAFSGTVFAAEQSRTIDNPDHCKVVERQPGQNDSGALSTSVQAGNGKVSAQTTGGNGVTVHSGNGSTSSSVATTTGSGGHTTVTSSDGNCTIYVNPGGKKE